MRAQSGEARRQEAADERVFPGELPREFTREGYVGKVFSEVRGSAKEEL